MRTITACLLCLTLGSAEGEAVLSPPPDFVRSLAAAPATQAAVERLAASRRAIGASGRLPDPMLGVGYARASTEEERWPMYEARIEQPLPRWGERDAMRAKATAEATVNQVELLDVLGGTAAELATLLAEAEAARAQWAVVVAQITRTVSLSEILAARSAAGTGGSAELLAVQSQQAALAVERDNLQRLAVDAEQDARALLGLADAEPLPLFSAPAKSDIHFDRVPGVLAGQARAGEAEAMFSEARAARYPETAVGLRYEFEKQPGEPMHTIGVEFRVSLPVWQGAAADLEVAASARRRAAKLDATGSEHQARALLGRAERAAAVATSARQAAESTRARLDSEYDALIQTAATAGGMNVVLVLDILDRLGEAERLVIEAEAAARQAAAGLWRLAPPDLANILTERNQP